MTRDKAKQRAYMRAYRQQPAVKAKRRAYMRAYMQQPAVKAKQRAYARLVAAAPDLLDALKQSLSWLSSYPGEGAMNAYTQARAAIAKAEGR